MSRFVQGTPVLVNAAALQQVMTADGKLVVTLDGKQVIVSASTLPQIVWNDVSIPGSLMSPVQYAVYRGSGVSPTLYYRIATVSVQAYLDNFAGAGTWSYYVVPIYEGTVFGVQSNVVQITVTP